MIGKCVKQMNCISILTNNWDEIIHLPLLIENYIVKKKQQQQQNPHPQSTHKTNKQTNQNKLQNQVQPLQNKLKQTYKVQNKIGLISL